MYSSLYVYLLFVISEYLSLTLRLRACDSTYQLYTTATGMWSFVAVFKVFKSSYHAIHRLHVKYFTYILTYLLQTVGVSLRDF